MVIFVYILSCVYLYCSGSESVQLGNHLGNVLVTVSDKKKGIADPLMSSLISHFESIMLSGTDYYPFGMAMRVGGDNQYKYGFNGKENDNEVKGGDGLQQDYGFRIYDPRLGKFLSVDPLTSAYPWYTPYQFAGNKPISFIDLDGLEEAPPPTPYRERESSPGYKKYSSEDKKGIYANVFENETWPADLEYYDKTWTFTRYYNGENEHWWLDGNRSWHKYTPDYKAFSPSLLSPTSFSAEIGGDLSIGGQIGLKGSIGAVKGSAELNAGSVSLLSGKLNINSKAGFTPEGSYIFKDGEAKFKQGIKLQISTPFKLNNGDLGIGGFYENQFSMNKYGDMTQGGDDYGLSLVVPVLSNDLEKFGKKWATDMEKIAFNSLPKSDYKGNIGKKFFGLDFTFGAKFFLGAEIKLKLGVNY